ncbi:uncharacterized protein E5676_scaffold426G00540 [Cucumis melo var. makuwa]|uniref:Uncharacterized protein n=1 Tax=Cucumis melo var. makuwa TaxID=1194695 RepID=A0A5D3E4M2_CUCMM|nr:uncharacterized protein E6C27_scaffold149G00560 [Cucumis melo var. makuwa]TYK30511.1 uncharacterized protein E5676_scaffold426G00540 [Cucumis melo var. makuwa]
MLERLPAPLSQLALLLARSALQLLTSLLSQVSLSPLGLISVDGKNPLILDLGATDYLTGFSKHFVSYTPCAGLKFREDDWHCPT